MPVVSGGLSGCCVWISRPVDQAVSWARAVERAGGTVLLQPLLEIGPPADAARAIVQLGAAEEADVIIATSANAVDGAWRLRPDFAPRGLLIAVGHATADALTRASGRAVRVPAREHTSEGVLALPELTDCRGQRVAILGGEGGRQTLADVLSKAGAQIDRIALYRRHEAHIDARRLDALLAQAQVVVVTSGESLAHLVRLAGAARADALSQLQLMAPSARVLAEAAGAIDWHTPPVAMNGMDIEHLLAALALVWPAGRQ